jgi:hypothetical protein
MDGGFLSSRPRPCMGCSAWDDDDRVKFVVIIIII